MSTPSSRPVLTARQLLLILVAFLVAGGLIGTIIAFVAPLKPRNRNPGGTSRLVDEGKKPPDDSRPGTTVTPGTTPSTRPGVPTLPLAEPGKAKPTPPDGEAPGIVKLTDTSPFTPDASAGKTTPEGLDALRTATGALTG